MTAPPTNETPSSLPPPARAAAAKQQQHTEREELLEQISELLERPMILLSLVWLVVVVVDLAGYKARWLDVLGWVLWSAFVLHFLLEFTIAPRKIEYLRTNWLTALALVAPALRLLRIARLVRLLRAARAARGLRLLRVVSTANRGLRTARKTLARRGLPYAIAINVLVLFLGAGGMYAFESRGGAGEGLRSYGDALWWTAMLLTTLGANYEPVTVEGRLLAWLLALFAFSVFGYVTASFASLFVQQDRQADANEHGGEAAGAPDAARPLRDEIGALRDEVRALRASLLASPPGEAGGGSGGAPDDEERDEERKEAGRS